MLSNKVALCVFSNDVVDEEILGDDHIPFEPHHFSDVRDAA